MLTNLQEIAPANKTQSIETINGKVTVKWPEILSLGALQAAVAISWIAYQEYQPILVAKFQIAHLSHLLVVTKALVLVLIPVLAGWIADKILVSRGKYFIVYTVGISATAMIFMVVASLISISPEHPVASALPIMLVLWLIGMSVFLSPALSMLESFASNRNLPIAVGVIILITDIIYALEPLVVRLVQFFGETLTFVVGAVLVFGTGLLFKKVASDEVTERQVKVQKIEKNDGKQFPVAPILFVGVLVGIGRAFLVEFIPFNSPLTMVSGEQFSFFLLGISALTSFGFSHYLSRNKVKSVLPVCLSGMLLGVGALVFTASNPFLFTLVGIVLALSFGVAHMSSFTFAFGKLTVRHITLGIGLFLGASALAEGLLELIYAFQ